MKSQVLFSAVTFLALTASAQIQPTICQIKAQNAASFQLAQDLAVPVQATKVVNFQDGSWEQKPSDNSGASIVEVTYKETGKRYIVSAQQIGSSTNCKIKTVIEDTLSRPF